MSTSLRLKRPARQAARAARPARSPPPAVGRTPALGFARLRRDCTAGIATADQIGLCVPGTPEADVARATVWVPKMSSALIKRHARYSWRSPLSGLGDPLGGRCGDMNDGRIL